MKVLFLLIFTILSLFSSEFKLKKWKDGETFGAYLTSYGIDSTKFYNQINPDDIKFLSAIQAGATFFENTKNGKLQETLIPLGEEMQIYIKNSKDGYKFDIIPIKYKTVKDKFSINIQNSCFSDIKNVTNNPNLATYLKKIFTNYVDFTKLKKGDTVSVSYSQKSIDGIPWGDPIIKSAYIKSGSNEFLAIKKQDEYKIWSDKNSTTIIKKFLKASKYKAFTNPLHRMRITSTFTYKRWHPILHRYRPHLGIDIGAPNGTPISAIASGKVIYAGWMRGYGKVTKIAHGGGYVSLYAHQSKILVKVGQRVKAHQIIGKVGSTGRSTGHHLHLGVYKRGKAINPFRVLHKIIKISNGVNRTVKIVKNIKNLSKALPYREKRVYNTLTKISPKNSKPFVWKDLKNKIDIKIAKREKNDNRIKLSSAKGDA